MKLVDILKSRFIFHSPFRLIHLVTSRCNCKCKICDLWKKSPRYRDDLSLEEIFEMLEDAQKAGMMIYTAMGGEPLLRDDLPQILQYAKKLNFVTSIVTNGFFLIDRYNEILPFIDVLAVSIDSNDELHDEMHGIKGLREKAIEGIKVCKNSKTKLMINSIISNVNLNKIEDLLNLSRELGVSISYQPMDIIREYNENFKPNMEELQKAFSKILEFKKVGYNIVNSSQYLQNFSSKKQYVCHGPKCFITVEANGTIVSCLNYYDKIWGNVKNKKFKEIFNSKDFRQFCKKVEHCNNCNVACVIESSLAYSLNPRFILDKAATNSLLS